MRTGSHRNPGIASFARAAGLVLGLSFSFAVASAQAKPATHSPEEAKHDQDVYQTLYLTNLTQPNDANDIQTDLRNILPKTRIYFVPSQAAMSLCGPADEIALARRILTDLDRIQKMYRLTYTTTETDSGKKIGVQHFAVVVVSGGKTELKQGSRVPVVIGEVHPDRTKQGSQVQYVDVGLNIEASLNSYLDGVRLRTKVEQSTLAEEESGVGAQDPLIRQAFLEGTSTLVQGKPLVLGSLDIPGSTRHQEIEVVSEQIR